MRPPIDRTSPPWWELEDPLDALTAAAEHLRDRDRSRRTMYRVWDDLYDGVELGSPSLYPGLIHAAEAIGWDSTVFNFAARAADFCHAKATAETPSVRAVGHGADPRQHARARGLTRFLAGLSNVDDLGTVLPRAVLCCLRTGTGAVKVVERDGRPDVEVVHPSELLVDPDDGRDMDPRVLYHVAGVDRRGLALQWPESADRILEAPASDEGQDAVELRRTPWGQPIDSDGVRRYEAWVLPRHDRPGRHVIAVRGALLLDEEWTATRFPVSFLRMTDPRPGGGFWGVRGLMERLDAAQFRIDELVAHVSEALLHANMKAFVPEGNDEPLDQIADPTISVIRIGPGGPPHFVVPEVIGQETVEILRQWVTWLYQLAGMDEGAAGSMKPAGVDSAIAIRTYHDFTSQTWVDLLKRYGSMVREVALCLIDRARLMSEDEPDWSIRFSQDDVLREMRWSEVDMDRDSFVIELEEASPVPDTLAGMLQEAEEDAAAGRVSPAYLERLRQDPDREYRYRRSSAEDVEYVDHVIERLMDPEAETPPVLDETPWDLAADALRAEVLRSVRLGRDPAVVARLQDYAQQVAEARPQPPQQVPPAAPGPVGGPTGT